MYRMMIVDADSAAAQRIRDEFPWAEHGILPAYAAGDGPEALLLCERHCPDIVVTEIALPALDGFEFIARVKELLPAARIVILSAIGEFSYAQRAIELGVSAYLLKPAGREELMAAVMRCVRSLNESAFGGVVHAEEEDELGRRVIRQARGYIKARQKASVSLGEVAQYVSLSPAYFSRLFKRETGVSFIDYVKQSRVDAAKKLLRETNRKVYDISAELGYQSVQYFTTLFRESVGMTPLEYREKQSAYIGAVR